MVKEQVAKKGSWGCFTTLLLGLFVGVPLALAGSNYAFNNGLRVESGGSFNRRIYRSLADFPYGKTILETDNRCSTLVQTPRFLFGDGYRVKYCGTDTVSDEDKQRLERFRKEFPDEF